MRVWVGGTEQQSLRVVEALQQRALPHEVAEVLVAGDEVRPQPLHRHIHVAAVRLPQDRPLHFRKRTSTQVGHL
jgi:hypothetical protein